MKISCFNPDNIRRFLLALVFAAGLATSAAAADENGNASSNEKDPESEIVHIKADRLETDNEKKTAEFIGDVVATQGQMEVVSDRLKIYYENLPGEGEEEKKGSTQDSIKKMVATGHVTITMDNRVAISEQAVYTAGNGVLVLTGANSKVTSEGNSVTGDKITLYRFNDKMIVESSSRERVEAILYPKEKGQE